MATLEIRTNNVPRFTLDWWDLTPKEQAEFDYIKDGEGTFFRYKGWTYDLGEFMRCTSDELKGWDGYVSDTFFSGVLVKLVDAGEKVIVGQYFLRG